jgi:hypothetical protein
MELAKSNGKKTEPVNTKYARAPLYKTGRKPKAEKLVCRYCGSDDLAPSFIMRGDRRCRKCFRKRYSSAPRAKKARNKELVPGAPMRGSGAQTLAPFVPVIFAAQFSAEAP